jgi:hypothetical protein
MTIERQIDAQLQAAMHVTWLWLATVVGCIRGRVSLRLKSKEI